MAVSTWIFWILVGIVAVPLVLFPVSIAVLGGLGRRGFQARDIEPTVSVLIAAYEEEEGIRAKIRNTLDQHYPADRLQVVVVDDGSDDDTVGEVRAIDDPRVVLVQQEERQGKSAALNRGFPHCTGEIVLFTDANAELEPAALARLVRPFADPAVGGVCGNQLNRRGTGALAAGEVLYWEYDKFLKRMESRTGSIVGADGSLYAIRREHFEPVPRGAGDDYFISSGVISHGARLVFEESARSVESPLEATGDQFRRRVRITSRALRSLYLRRRLLNPFRYGIYSYVVAGHKILRRVASPVILLLLPATMWAAAESGGFFVLALGLQLAVYAAAGLGHLSGKRRGTKVLSVPYYFVLGIVATSVGIVRFIRGERRTVWEPIRR